MPTQEEIRDAAGKWARSQLWLKGNLSFKYHATQLKIAEAIRSNPSPKFFLLCSRRLGKSHMLLCMAFETAIRQPNARVLFLAPTQRAASEIATDLAVKILADCPEAIRPTFMSQAKEYHFKNGSIVRLKGTNNETADSLRGGDAHVIFIDECGQVDRLDYIVRSVCSPMTLTTNGRIILASTPPPSPGHDSAKIYEDLLRDGATVRFTIMDTPHLNHAQRAKALRETGEHPDDVEAILAGTIRPKNTTTRRELYVEFITDASQALIPEFEGAQADIVVEHPRAEYFDGYVSIDPGSRDLTGILYGWFDFLQNKLVIEAETLIHNPPTKVIAADVKEKEAKYLENASTMIRYLDNDGRLITDFRTDHQLSFQKAKKPEIFVSIQELRHAIQTRQILINPRCEQLVFQLSAALWNVKGTDMSRERDGQPGHNDLVAALRYMLHGLNRQRNPYPEHYFARGGKLGPGLNQWVSPFKRPKKKLNLHDDTPLGRKLSKGKKRK